MTTSRGSWTTITSELQALRAIARRDGARAAIRLRLGHHAGVLRVAEDLAAVRAHATRLQRDLDAARAEVATQSALLEALEARHHDLDQRTAQARVVARLEAGERALAVAPEGADALITVLTPTLGRPVYLRRAIASVLAQTHEEWELLVLDNGGDPATADVVRAAADRRVRLVDATGRRGQGPARNLGLREAAGALIVYLDDDNVLAPGWLHAVAVTAARRPQALAFHGARVYDHPEHDAWTLFDAVDAETVRDGNPLDTGVLAHRAGAPVTWSDDPAIFPDWEIAATLVAAGHAPVPIAARAVVYTTAAPDRMCARDDFDDRVATTRARVTELLQPTPRPTTEVR